MTAPSPERLRELHREWETSGTYEAQRDYEAAALEALPALLHQLAEREAEVERLREIASQINTDWIPANKKLAERAETAERAREECLRLAEKWERISSTHGVRCFTGDDHLIFANELRVALGQQPAALLAASGGSRED